MLLWVHSVKWLGSEIVCLREFRLHAFESSLISSKSVSRSNFFIAYSFFTLHDAPTRYFHVGVYHESGAASFKLQKDLEGLAMLMRASILILSEHRAWAAGRNISVQVLIRTHAVLYEKRQCHLSAVSVFWVTEEFFGRQQANLLQKVIETPPPPPQTPRF